MAFVYQLARDSRRIGRISQQNNLVLRFINSQSVDSNKKSHTFRFVESTRGPGRLPFSYIFNFEFKNVDCPKFGQVRAPLNCFPVDSFNILNSSYGCKNKTIRLAIKKKRKRLGERLSLRYR